MKKIILVIAGVLGLVALELMTTLLPPIPSIQHNYLSSLFAFQLNGRESQNARATLTQCDTDMIHLKDLESENDSLRKQLSFSQRTAFHPILAYTIGMSSDPFHSLFIINKGSRDGIVEQAPVIAGDGILVGTIFSVDQHTSTILPLSDPRSKVLAHIVQHDTPINGIAQGQFNVGLLFTLVPITAQLHKDDLVITSGLQESIPAGLAIGTIQDINKRAEDLFQSASVSQGTHLDEVPVVSVLVAEKQ